MVNRQPPPGRPGPTRPEPPRPFSPSSYPAVGRNGAQTTRLTPCPFFLFFFQTYNLHKSFKTPNDFRKIRTKRPNSSKNKIYVLGLFMCAFGSLIHLFDFCDIYRSRLSRLYVLFDRPGGADD